MGDGTRWIVSATKETDTNMRTHLAQRGMKKDDISRFIEDAVKWRMLDLTLAEAGTGFADLWADELNDLIEEAIAAARGH